MDAPPNRSALPASSVKVPIQVGEMSQADLNELRGPNRDNMMGEQFTNMDAGRYDTEPRGFASQPNFVSQPTQPTPEQAVFMPTEQPNQPNYQQLYGQSENEKGEWRRLADGLGQQMLMLQQQIQEIASRPPVIQQTGPAQPPPRIFSDRNPAELLTWGELEEVVQGVIRPAMEMTAQQSQDMAMARAQRMLPQWDIQPVEEAQAMTALRTRFPTLEQRFAATEINDMIRDQVLLQRAQGAGVRAAPTANPVGRVTQSAAVTRPVVIDPSRAVHRATYIESAPPMSQPEPTPPMNVQQAFIGELQELERTKGSRLSATEYKQLLIKHGVAQVNDFGENVLTR